VGGGGGRKGRKEGREAGRKGGRDNLPKFFHHGYVADAMAGKYQGKHPVSATLINQRS
jgi:hypothetical protein